MFWPPIKICGCRLQNVNKRLKTAELETSKFQFAKRTNDASIELAVAGGKIRVGSIDFRKAGYGQRRPT